MIWFTRKQRKTFLRLTIMSGIFIAGKALECSSVSSIVRFGVPYLRRARQRACEPAMATPKSNPEKALECKALAIRITGRKCHRQVGSFTRKRMGRSHLTLRGGDAGHPAPLPRRP